MYVYIYIYIYNVYIYIYIYAYIYIYIYIYNKDVVDPLSCLEVAAAMKILKDVILL